LHSLTNEEFKLTKTIPLVEPWFPPEVAQAVAQQIGTGFVGPGPATQKFAEQLATYAGMPFCVPTVSGTAALSVAAVALGLKIGDEILVPAYGVISTINAFASIGLAPRLVGINRGTGCMEPEQLERAIGPATRAVCFVNFSGRTGPELVEIARICEERGIPLIEDSACALGHRFDGHAAGSFGTVSIYSFSVPKVLTTGQGGAVLVRTPEHRDAAIRYIDHGDTEWRKTNLNRGIGTNLRFNDILSSFGLAQLADLDARLARRRASHAAIKRHLGTYLYGVPGVEAPLQNIVFCERPDDLVGELRTRGVSAVRQYRAIYQHPPYANLNGVRCANSEFWTDCAVFLPFGVALTADDGDAIGRAVLDTRIALIPAGN
jgi:perosamine synthetase